jgi:DHA2 family multidrug resistance protein-like MFS transporter
MEKISNARKWGTVAVGSLAGLVLSIDLTALNLAIPNLIEDLKPSATQILWISDIYGFVLAGLLITMGYLGDRIGRKKLLLIGMFGFAAASALTAYAHSAEQLIAARALLGLAGATIMPSTLSLTRNVFTDHKERTVAIGIGAGVGGLGVGLGPVFGGALLDHFWWGSVFLINLPVMVVILIAGAVIIPESRDPRPGRLDWLGVPLSIIGVMGVVYALKESVNSGLSIQVVATAAIGTVCLLLFFRRQLHTGSPLIDVRLFRNPAFAGSVGTNAFAMFALIAQSLIFSQYFQLVLGWSPLKAGLAGLPGALGAMAGGAALAPQLINIIGRARTIAVGLTVAGAGCSLYLLVGTDLNYWLLLVGMVSGGIGVGMALTVTSDTIIATVPRDRAGAASAISETATELGGALGLAVLGTVLNAAYRSSIEVPANLPAGISAGVKDSLAGAIAAGAPAGVIDAARESFVQGMHTALGFSLALNLIAAAGALVALKNVPNEIEEEKVEAVLV